MRILILSAAAVLAASPAFAQLGAGVSGAVGGSVNPGGVLTSPSPMGGVTGAAALTGGVAPIPAAPVTFPSAAAAGIPASATGGAGLSVGAAVTTATGGGTLGTIQALNRNAAGAITGISLRTTAGVRTLPLSSLSISAGGVSSTYTAAEIQAMGDGSASSSVPSATPAAPAPQ